MCGIVGYVGEKKVKEVLIDGLRTLEYRGYDSAGISVFDGNNIKRVRAAGKLVKLENKLDSVDFNPRTTPRAVPTQMFNDRFHDWFADQRNHRFR